MTAIGPVVAPVGTLVAIVVSLVTVNAAAVPLNVTDVAPVKPVPVTVTDVPSLPLVGSNPVTVGAVGGGRGDARVGAAVEHRAVFPEEAPVVAARMQR